MNIHKFICVTALVVCVPLAVHADRAVNANDIAAALTFMPGRAANGTFTNPTITGGTFSGGNVSGQNVTPAGASVAQGLAALFSQTHVVPDWYKITADGSDDAPSIRRALTALCAGGGGNLSLLPRHYQIASAITQTCPVLISGKGWMETIGSAVGAPGTWLDIMGTTFTPWTIKGTSAAGAEFRDFAISQPGQPVAPTSGSWTPAAYPHVFDVENIGGYTGFKHLFFAGVTNGIKSINGGRTVIDGLFGQFFNNDVLFDVESDVSRISHLHSWPYWSQNVPVIAYQQANHVGVALGRVDGPILESLFVFATVAGVQTFTGIQGGTVHRALIGNLSCDSAQYCLRVEGVGTTLAISNLSSFGQAGVTGGTPLAGSAAIKIDGGGTFQIGTLQMADFDLAPILGTSTTTCSTVYVGSMSVDYSLSTQNAVQLFNAAACGANAYSRLYVGIQPGTVLAGKRFTAHGGAGATVFYPTSTSQN